MEVSDVMKNGFVLTIDYGYSSAELYSPSRSSGTLVCYNKHAVNNEYYNHIGQQDITAHVNFSALYYWGLQYGLQCCGYTLQSHFLQGLGLLRALEDKARADIGLYKLIMSMGRKFKVLIQQKGLPQQHLSGLQFANTRVW